MMKNHFLLALAIAVLCSFGANSQNYFTLDHNGTPSLYQNLDSAVANAIDGDHIYLPGGAYTIGTLVINKEIKMFGVGYDPDSATATGITLLIGDIRLDAGADSSLFTGFELNGDINVGTAFTNPVIHKVSIIRVKCNVMRLGTSSNNLSYACYNFFVSECVVDDIVVNWHQNLLVEKSIITGWIEYTNNNCIFRNNIFTYSHAQDGCNNYGPLGYQYSNRIIGATFENNIFFDLNPLHTIYGCTHRYTANCTFNNNMFGGTVTFPVTGNNIGVNNITDTAANVLVNGCAAYTNNCDYHLVSGTSLANAGTDGTDIGIYGTAQPFKEGAIPMNPHIRAKSITTNNNTIYLNINVSAQDR